MGELTDIHSHILPEIDDGSESLEKSLAMIAEEISQGVKNIFCTPHYRIPYTKEKEETKRIFSAFNEKVKEKNLPVNLYLGQEIAVNENTLSMLKSGRLLTLNDGKYVLLEFCLTKKTMDVSETVHEFVIEGFKPIVAHIERYPYLKIEDAYDVKRGGGLIQINADAALEVGKIFGGAHVKKLIEENLVDFVASDYHYCRKNNMKEAYHAVTKRYGEEVAEKLFFINAERILKNRD